MLGSWPEHSSDLEQIKNKISLGAVREPLPASIHSFLMNRHPTQRPARAVAEKSPAEAFAAIAWPPPRLAREI
jgi:hypothetical protein